MRVQVVDHQANGRRFRITLDDVLHHVGEIDLGSTLGEQHLSPTSLRFADHHHVANAIALIFRVIACRSARFDRNGRTHFRDQLLGAFIEAHDRISRIVRRCVQIQHVFHGRDKICADRGNAPFLLLPRLQSVFLKAAGLLHG